MRPPDSRIVVLPPNDGFAELSYGCCTSPLADVSLRTVRLMQPRSHARRCMWSIESNPVALSARDFADAWIEEEWKDASQWTKPGILRSVRKLHDALSSILFFQFDAVRQCSDQKHHFEVAIVSSNQRARHVFSILGTPAAFEMSSVSAWPTGLCDGIDIPIDQ
jgi:hypothetical protein